MPTPNFFPLIGGDPHEAIAYACALDMIDSGVSLDRDSEGYWVVWKRDVTYRDRALHNVLYQLGRHHERYHGLDGDGWINNPDDQNEVQNNSLYPKDNDHDDSN